MEGLEEGHFRQNKLQIEGMSLGVSIRNLSGDIKWVVGYINLKFKGKVSQDEDLRVTGILWHLKQWD